MDKTLTPAEQALVEKLVYVLSILEGMSKRFKALEDKVKTLEERLIDETSLLCSFLNSDALKIKKLEDQVNGDGK